MTTQCSACQAPAVVAECNTCHKPLCSNCVVACSVCGHSLCRDDVQLTSRGRRLCASCMAERNARRGALKKEKKRSRLEREAFGAPIRHSTPKPAAPPVADTSFSALGGSPLSGSPSAPGASSPPPSPAAPTAGVSFEDLTAGGAVIPARPAEEDFDHEDPGHPKDDDDDGIRGRDEDEREKRKYGLEGLPGEGASRLELPPMDERKPIFTGSGYQPPKKWQWITAYLFFGLAGYIFLQVNEDFRDLLFRFETTDLQFNENQMPVAQDDNQLRNAANISQLNQFSLGPVFVISWFFMVVYVGGSILIIGSTIYSAIHGYFARKKYKEAMEKEPVDPFA